MKTHSVPAAFQAANLEAMESRAWELRLYVAGPTPKSLAAFRNIEKVCEEHLAGRYSIEVVDLKSDPRLAQRDQILAVPTLVRNLPAPIRKFIGAMSDTRRVLDALGLPGEDADLLPKLNGGNDV